MEDDVLVEEIKSGSKAALDIIIRKYYYEIFSFIYRRTQQQALSYDLTQEVFTKVYMSIATYRDKGKFRSWLLTITLNHLRDYMKSKAHKQMKLENEWVEEKMENNQGNVAYIYEKKEESLELKNALKKIPDTQSEAIILKYYHGYKYHEIAEMTATKETTVKSRIFQGLKKLSNLVRRDDDEGRYRKDRGDQSSGTRKNR